MSEIRYDAVHNKEVIIAPERLKRPQHHVEGTMHISENTHCPFCQGNESMTPPEIFALREEGSKANDQGWFTRVIPNRYKALQIEAAYEYVEGDFSHWNGFGAHEIIVDTPKHLHSMTQWEPQTYGCWLRTLRARVSDLRRDGRIAYISLFKNEGAKAGATQAHCHTQLIGLPLIPTEIKAYFERSFDHYQQFGEGLLATQIKHEIEAESRVIAQEGGLIAYAPYASSYPFEVMIASIESVGGIDQLGDDTIDALSVLLDKILKNMKNILGEFAFNLSIATPPLQVSDFGYDILSQSDIMCRFAIRIMPRLYSMAGFEVGTGMMINPVLPEEAAQHIRESMNE